MRFLFATDFSNDAKHALHLLVPMHLVTSAEMTLLHVVGRTYDGSTESEYAVNTIAALPLASSATPIFLVTTLTHTHRMLLAEEPGMERMWQSDSCSAALRTTFFATRSVRCGYIATDRKELGGDSRMQAKYERNSGEKGRFR